MNPPLANTLTAADAKPPNAAPRTSNARETVETIVFVVVLVLLLKTFVAEAFVIPTGSMATTLWGDQKWAVCPQCDFGFPVNCSSERDAADRGGAADSVTGCTCPNCRFHIDFGPESPAPACSTGDRVVVAKFLYDLRSAEPEREDVVVFKFPKDPQRNWSALNYIKRLVGRPGETIALYYGDLYVHRGSKDANATPLTYDKERRPDDANDLWLSEYMYRDNEEAITSFHQGGFEITRKPPELVIAMRRIVFDNNHQARDLQTSSFPSRWAAEHDAASTDERALDFQRLRQRGRELGAWTEDGEHAFRHAQRGGAPAWLRYRHLVIEPSRDKRTPLAGLGEVKPSLITDFLGYNTFQTQWGRHGLDIAQNWVGDLMLECAVQLDSTETSPGEPGASATGVSQKQPGASATGARRQLILELARGVDLFQARWDLTTGICSLVRINSGAEEILDSQPTHLKSKGAYEVRFANVDERLLVWVDGKLPFGAGVPYPGPSQRGPTANDLRPAGIGVTGAAASVRQLKLWRDVYYTARADDRSDARPELSDWTNPEHWGPLRELRVATFYVQPGHYLCLGDNSPQSADSCLWGTVPRRLMLGRALLTYFPPSRMGPIR